MALQNGVNPVHVNDGECNDLSGKDNGNCTYGVNMEAKENSVSIIFEKGNTSSKKHLLDKNFSPSKRNRVDSADEHVLGYQHEKQVGINECDDFLIYAKKIKCNGSLNIESKKEKPLSPHGKGVLENSTDIFRLVSESGGCHRDKDIRENLGEGSLEGSHDRCIASNWGKSRSHNEEFNCQIPSNATVMLQHTSGGEYCQQHEVETIPTKVLLPDKIQPKFAESCIGMSTTMMPPHTSGDKPCQNSSLDETKDDTEHRILAMPTDVDDPHKVSNIINESESKWKMDFQLNEPNAASLNISQQPVISDKAVADTVNGCGAEVSSDSDEYHNETVDLAAKKHEFLSSQCTFGHDFSASIEQTENNICMKCNGGGELLVCKTTSCPLMVHKSCLGISAQVDADSNFFCPFCAYCNAISEYLEAKKKASLARKDLGLFINKDIKHENTNLLHEVHRKEHSFSRTSSKYEHIHDKNNGNDQFPGTEDNKEDHVGEHEVNSLHAERSQHQAPTSFVNSSCREKEIVNNGIVEGLSREEGGAEMHLKSSTRRGVEENQVPAELVDGDDNQSNTKEIQQEMLEQHNTVRKQEPVYVHGTDEEEVSKDKHETPTVSRYSMRFWKRKRQ